MDKFICFRTAEQREKERFFENMPTMLDSMEKELRKMEFDGSSMFFEKIHKVWFSMYFYED